MRLRFNDERVLAVMAHPDDAELLCAGTLSRAQQEGAEVGICVLCAGDKGLPSGASTENLAETRRVEMADAAKLLKSKVFWFGCPDGGLFDTLENRRKLIEIYRQYSPTLVIAHDLCDYHPDHRAASVLAEAATWFCASKGHVTESSAMAAPPALWFADTLNMSGFEPQFYVDVSGQLEVKKQMLGCHRSQLQRGKDGDFAPLMDLMVRQATTRGAQSGVSAAEAFRTHQAFKRIRAW
ncbi:MAG TPA: PIG-L family deacetylase [Tepidisphaeraceae bacterium]|jgi:LmbE family N-acetylglucosaminyl deacetylase|nr:PIG-L family deacetylase [Tepidisphaeraceae bacterium]